MYEEVVETLAYLYDFFGVWVPGGSCREGLVSGPSDFGARLSSLLAGAPFFAGLGALPHRGGPR